MTTDRQRVDLVLDQLIEVEKRLTRALEMLAEAVVVAEGA